MKASPLPNWMRVFAVLFSLALVAAACSDDDSDVTPDAGVDEVEESLDEDDESIAGGGDGMAEDDDMADDTSEGDDMVEDDDMAEDDDMSEDGEAVTFQTDLESLNDSGVSGTATVEANADGMVTVSIETTGFVGGNPHAAHFHIGGANECPGEDVAGDDDLISTAEGIPAYGEVMVSLTTEGAVDAASALAVERFPVADTDGSLSYERSFALPDGVTVEDLGSAVVVQHGFASLGGDEAAYDGEAESSLDPSLPLEATIPVACGPLEEQAMS